MNKNESLVADKVVIHINPTKSYLLIFTLVAKTKKSKNSSRNNFLVYHPLSISLM